MKKEKTKISCPDCGKSYEIDLDPAQKYSDVECPECGCLIPLENKQESAPVQVQIVKIELPQITFRWMLNTVWLFYVACIAVGIVFAVPIYILLSIVDW